jgi:hypothetical protein
MYCTVKASLTYSENSVNRLNGWNVLLLLFHIFVNTWETMYVVVNGYYYVKWETYKVKTKITKPVINIKFRYATSRLDEKSTITIDKKLFVHVETIIFFKVHTLNIYILLRNKCNICARDWSICNQASLLPWI